MVLSNAELFSITIHNCKAPSSKSVLCLFVYPYFALCRNPHCAISIIRTFPFVEIHTVPFRLSVPCLSWKSVLCSFLITITRRERRKEGKRSQTHVSGLYRQKRIYTSLRQVRTRNYWLPLQESEFITLETYHYYYSVVNETPNVHSAQSVTINTLPVSPKSSIVYTHHQRTLPLPYRVPPSRNIEEPQTHWGAR